MKTRVKVAVTVLWTLFVLTALSASWQALGAPNTAEVWLGVLAGLATLVVAPVGYTALWRKSK